MTTGMPSARNSAAEIERARKLVGLHADQTDHAAAGLANALGDGADIHEVVALVAGFDLDLDVGTEHVRLRAMLDQRIDAGETVRGNVRAPPLNDITVIVIMRRLDQRDPESARPHGEPIPGIIPSPICLPPRIVQADGLFATEVFRLPVIFRFRVSSSGRAWMGLGCGATVSDRKGTKASGQGVRLTDEQRIDWLRLIRSQNMARGHSAR